MIKQLLRFTKRLPLYALFGRWRTDCPFEPGYTIALPCPMDMPFLLSLALKGLTALNTPNCKQILVVPDGWGDDQGAGLRKVVDEFDDPRIQMVELRGIDYRVIRAMRPPGCARTHWMLVVNSVLNARHEYIFLHDADAFFLEADGLEKQYGEAKSRNMDVLGVTPRWDPFFKEHNLTIAGTWELLFSTRWARKRSPMALYPGGWSTPHGDAAFDSMLYSQYLDAARGTIGVMDKPPEFIHFNGTIYTYRTFRDRGAKTVTDELFRILLLSVIETAFGITGTERVTPELQVLERGLDDSAAPVSYRSEINQRGYAEFRSMVSQMNRSPAFVGERAARINEQLVRFDEHFEYDEHKTFRPALEEGVLRQTGLG